MMDGDKSIPIFKPSMTRPGLNSKIDRNGAKTAPINEELVLSILK